MDTPNLSKPILAGLREALKPLGFRQKNNTFSASINDVVLMVNLQSSSETTKQRLVATINLGVLSKILAEKLGQRIESTRVWGCHWRERIGDLLPEPVDYWCEVSNEEQSVLAAEELVYLLNTYGLPAMQKVSSTSKLRDLWESGEAPGLTEFQRQNYLSLLEG